VDEATMSAYAALVAEQADTTRRLAEILKKDLRDLAVLRKERANGFGLGSPSTTTTTMMTTTRRAPFY